MRDLTGSPEPVSQHSQTRQHNAKPCLTTPVGFAPSESALRARFPLGAYPIPLCSRIRATDRA